MQPEQVAVFVAEFATEWNRLLAEASADATHQRRELATIERKLAGVVDAIADGFRASGLQQNLDEFETRRTALQNALDRIPASTAPCLHPNLAEVRERVARLHKAFRADVEGPAILEQVRSLVDRVVLHPGRKRTGLEIELIGEIATMMALATGRDDARDRRLNGVDHNLFERSVKVVAGTGFEPVTFRL